VAFDVDPGWPGLQAVAVGTVGQADAFGSGVWY
jgi:hypothetical protein